MDDKGRMKPVHMALCKRCAERTRIEYQERQVDYERTWSGTCGLCRMEETVHGVDLYPKIRRNFRRQTGGGERRRAGIGGRRV